MKLISQMKCKNRLFRCEDSSIIKSTNRKLRQANHLHHKERAAAPHHHGGNRDTYLLGKIQPLPLKTRMHIYGHSHIGEYKCPKERIFSQIQWVDWQDIPQVDVASFENIRGSYCHSVILQIYEDDTMGLFFRNHDEHRFMSAFFPSPVSYEKEGDYAQRMKLPWAPWDGVPKPE